MSTLKSVMPALQWATWKSGAVLTRQLGFVVVWRSPGTRGENCMLESVPVAVLLSSSLTWVLLLGSRDLSI